MDDQWERSIPFRALTEAEAELLLRWLDSTARVIKLSPLMEGKRNTNYQVTTLTGQTYLLRLFSPGDESWRKESALRRVLGNSVPMQRLLFIGQDAITDNQTYALYDYAEGKTLLSLLLEGYVPDKALVRELGEILAVIHNHRYERQGFLNEQLMIDQELPPLKLWYEMFLGPHARMELGAELSKRMARLVTQKSELLEGMERTISLIHGDFRPTNLIIHKGTINAVIDWEFAMAGHPIADVGQLFRYKELFPDSLKSCFVEAYNKNAASLLSENWEEEAKLRDLANLLQMLNNGLGQPAKSDDLKKLIAEMLVDFKQ
ncbi:MAG: aminoglycoside phosphotransferase family protein [Gorillibacterium sp.]|nr:aminoglycoside phosphotransferase family protein [Gorillibacterium sp.]